MLGFAAIVHLDLESREGEIGYMLDGPARGRGAASRAVDADHGLGVRDSWPANGSNCASTRRTRRRPALPSGPATGRDGVLRSVAFKDGLRTDTGVWSRLRND